MTTDSLWGDFEQLIPVRTPKSILKEQAEFLGQKTRGRLRGRVSDRSEDEEFGFDLDIVAPTLNNYAYTVLTVRHGIQLYPVRVETSVLPRPHPQLVCPDEAAFVSTLTKIPSAEKTRQIIASLVSQAAP